MRKGQHVFQQAVTLVHMVEDPPTLLSPRNPKTMTTVKSTTGVTVRSRSARAEVSSDTVQLAGRWRSMLIYLHLVLEPVGEPYQPPTSPNTARANANRSQNLAHTKHTCPVVAQGSHDNI